MVTFSPVSTPVINLGQNREQSSVRDDSALKDRLQSTKQAGSSLSKADTSFQKNYKEAQDFADLPAQQAQLSTSQGTRRGSLLDLTI